MTENRKNNPAQEDKIPSPLSQLVMMLATSALQHLGQLPDPISQKREVNLHGAQAAIDLLDALKEKTKGNLDEDEDHVLNETLNSLRLHYVRQANATASEETAEPTPEKAGEESETPSGPGTEPVMDMPPPRDRDDDDKRRYHKSYG